MRKILDQYAAKLPESFPGKYLDKLTNGALCWRTVQNLRCIGSIPADCFAKISPRKVVILRDPFLAWLETTIPCDNHLRN